MTQLRAHCGLHTKEQDWSGGPACWNLEMIWSHPSVLQVRTRRSREVEWLSQSSAARPWQTQHENWFPDFHFRGRSFRHAASKGERVLRGVSVGPHDPNIQWTWIEDSEEKDPAWASRKNRWTKPLSIHYLAGAEWWEKMKGQGSNACLIKLVTTPTLLWEKVKQV